MRLHGRAAAFQVSDPVAWRTGSGVRARASWPVHVVVPADAVGAQRGLIAGSSRSTPNSGGPVFPRAPAVRARRVLRDPAGRLPAHSATRQRTRACGCRVGHLGRSGRGGRRPAAGRWGEPASGRHADLRPKPKGRPPTSHKAPSADVRTEARRDVRVVRWLGRPRPPDMLGRMRADRSTAGSRSVRRGGRGSRSGPPGCWHCADAGLNGAV